MNITSFSQLDLSKNYSYADYLTWKFSERIELLKGYISQMAAPNVKHQRISRRLVRLIDTFLHNQKSICELFEAPFDVRLVKNTLEISNKDIYTVVQPDLCIICDPKKLDEQGCLGAPDLIIEIVSHNNTKRDVKDKFALYEENGVREYWIVRPYDHTLEQFVLKEDKYQFYGIFTHEDKIIPFVLPDLSLDLSEVFGK